MYYSIDYCDYWHYYWRSIIDDLDDQWRIIVIVDGRYLFIVVLTDDMIPAIIDINLTGNSPVRDLLLLFVLLLVAIDVLCWYR